MGDDPKALSCGIDVRTAIVCICNPAYPTGVRADPAEPRRFIASLP